MSKSGVAKVQHYVPQFLLRNFGSGKKDQLHVFDKHTGKSFVTNAKNVASESKFYDFRVGGIEATLEPSLSKLEGKTKPIIVRMLREESVEVLSAHEKGVLCAFFAVQFTRTRTFREQWRSIPLMLAEKLRATARSPKELEAVVDYIAPPEENEVKVESARMMATAPKDFGPHFATKTWHLLTTTRKHPFFISDNPLALQNMTDMKPFGNLGLAVRGIEIYFPLTPTRALAMWCPSHKSGFLQAAEQLRQLRTGAPHLIASHVRNPDAIERMASLMENGAPIPYMSENVMNFNSLQVGNAERYIFSCDNDFSLPRQMINAHPSLRAGPRMKSDWGPSVT